MIDAVLDTNVLISGYGWRGTPSAILTHLALGSFANYTSSVLLEELTESRSAVPAAC